MSTPKFNVGDVVRVICRSSDIMGDDDWGEDYERAVRGANLHTIVQIDTISDEYGSYCYYLHGLNWFLEGQLILINKDGVVSVTSLDYMDNTELDDSDKLVIKSYIEELENGW